MTESSNLYMFRSETSALLHGFAAESTGARLPAKLGPWATFEASLERWRVRQHEKVRLTQANAERRVVGLERIDDRVACVRLAFLAGLERPVNALALLERQRFARGTRRGWGRSGRAVGSDQLGEHSHGQGARGGSGVHPETAFVGRDNRACEKSRI